MVNTLLLISTSEIWFYAVLAIIVIIFIAMVTMQTRRRRTQQTEYAGMLETLRPGMRVKTVGGVIGVIREIREEAPDFKTVLLETGDEKNPSLVLYDLQAIYGAIDEEAVLKAKAEQTKNIEEHKQPDSGIEKEQNTFEAKKTASKSKKTN